MCFMLWLWIFLDSICYGMWRSAKQRDKISDVCEMFSGFFYCSTPCGHWVSGWRWCSVCDSSSLFMQPTQIKVLSQCTSRFCETRLRPCCDMIFNLNNLKPKCSLLKWFPRAHTLTGTLWAYTLTTNTYKFLCLCLWQINTTQFPQSLRFTHLATKKHCASAVVESNVSGIIYWFTAGFSFFPPTPLHSVFFK